MISVKSLLNLQVYVRLPSTKHVHVLRERVTRPAPAAAGRERGGEVVVVDVVVGLGVSDTVRSRDSQVLFLKGSDAEENALRVAEYIRPHRRLDAIVPCPLERRGRRKSAGIN